ncbi:hypothetical protein B0T26DRAFT_367389 [Lasiosphaeria miniovina]|uniref:Uncharacterized protein n=1 Tax=Lasiosphaeria miniovina TaxID=1954250 RepID=A0AA40DRL4_9PEZI|nr:uncharacterized protein B0T26DRAFT_367389 [Lasiosphaeria miniovina]KAK0713614.1 hypothetical protein B0T26DRAFT_367389 [Lasiosphaeria miniovina]
MSAVKDGEKSSNTARLLEMVDDPSIFSPTSPDQINNALIVFAILLRLNCGNLIHTFKQYIRDDFLDSDLSPYILNALKSSGLQFPSDILVQFDKEKWAFCPAKIEDMHDQTKALDQDTARWILPFCKRNNIGKGGTAVVDEVLIQEDLVPDTFKDMLRGCKYEDKVFGWCYQLAIKSFQQEAQDVFKTEITNFMGIKSLPGVVQYIGCFKLKEPNAQGVLRTTSNILLEYGELDLDEYLAIQYPPILNSEIINFWENIFQVAMTLAKLHNFEYQRHDGSTTTFDG